MSKTVELSSAQKAFYAAIKRSKAAVQDLRKTRASETIPVFPRPRSSKVRVTTATPTSDFKSIRTLVQRLAKLGNAKSLGSIICLTHPDVLNGEVAVSRGLQAFWTRQGHKPPEIVFRSDPLDVVLKDSPVAILLPPEDAPECTKGYIRVVLSETHTCMLLREEIPLK